MNIVAFWLAHGKQVLKARQKLSSIFLLFTAVCTIVVSGEEEEEEEGDREKGNEKELLMKDSTSR